MKKLGVFQVRIKDKMVAAFVVSDMFFSTRFVHAARTGLDHAKTVINSIQGDLLKIVPILAATILLFLSIGYAGRFIGRDTFLRWGIGVIIAGSATQITSMLFGKP